MNCLSWGSCPVKEAAAFADVLLKQSDAKPTNLSLSSTATATATALLSSTLHQVLLLYPSRLPLLLLLLLLPPPAEEALDMLSSLKSHEEGDQEHHRHSNPLHPNPQHGQISPSAHARQLLLSCAELAHRGDIPAAQRTASLLLATASPYGDSTDRLVHQFARALSLRVERLLPPVVDAAPPEALQSSYLSFNQVTPFLRFAHLTANQAILEVVDGRRQVHILDFDTSHGLQWPPLLQAIAERSDPKDPPSIRITGTGSNLEVLRRTGDRLQTFADSLNLHFHFHPLLLLPSTSSNPLSSSSADLTSSSFQLHPGETLAVNCVLFLHKLLKDGDGSDGSHDLRAFLQAVRAMNPAVVTVAEREASHNSPIFLQRFTEALDYYTAVFESLEATLPPTSRERVAVEQVWLSKEIEDVVSREGNGRRERHERFEWWEALMRRAGFTNLPLSPFALSQARLLLRLHYPSEGYQLQMVRDSFFLGWQKKSLFSVSSWH
ncbi:Scarecrow-like protein 18 [Musa troglodytarum]|uniref:Scarecrow-like protein 18 n=2 Tax=Musa troglodytarum TaxID=320322 RepID=A0A9E7E7S1_9LILI|nr:Scarecrow-like protein 18 [Musa troglodytarum]